MSKSKNKNNTFPFADEVKKLKHEFKTMIDNMSDDDFLDLISFLEFDAEDFEYEDWAFDEGWEDEAERFYNAKNNNSNNLTLIDNDDLPF